MPVWTVSQLLAGNDAAFCLKCILTAALAEQEAHGSMGMCREGLTTLTDMFADTLHMHDKVIM